MAKRALTVATAAMAVVLLGACAFGSTPDETDRVTTSTTIEPVETYDPLVEPSVTTEPDPSPTPEPEDTTDNTDDDATQTTRPTPTRSRTTNPADHARLLCHISWRQTGSDYVRRAMGWQGEDQNHRPDMRWNHYVNRQRPQELYYSVRNGSSSIDGGREVQSSYFRFHQSVRVPRGAATWDNSIRIQGDGGRWFTPSDFFDWRQNPMYRRTNVDSLKTGYENTVHHYQTIIRPIIGRTSRCFPGR